MIFTFAAFTLHSLFLPHHQDRDMFPAWMMMKICLVTLTVIRKTLSNSGCVNKILVLYSLVFLFPQQFEIFSFERFLITESYPAVIGVLLS